MALLEFSQILFNFTVTIFLAVFIVLFAVMIWAVARVVHHIQTSLQHVRTASDDMHKKLNRFLHVASVAVWLPRFLGRKNKN